MSRIPSDTINSGITQAVTGSRDELLDLLRLIEGHLSGGGGGGTYDRMEARVSKLETDMSEIKVTLATISERLSHVATKADVEAIRGEVREVKGGLEGVKSGLEGKLSHFQFITWGFVMMGIFVSVLALLLANAPRLMAAFGPVLPS